MDKRGTRLIETIFDTDNFFMQICEKILDLATVNLLFLLTSLPLLTIGIAKLSLYQTLFEIKGGRRVKVTAVYIKAFRENWRLASNLACWRSCCLLSVFLTSFLSGVRRLCLFKS